MNFTHDLGLEVVAEGIEDAECLVFLRTIGCDPAQGYFISRPVPAEELRSFLDRTYANAPGRPMEPLETVGRLCRD
jgi:EAL domain-containing protein (putative c-di-GMP-specific phosphodiesterase class I)